MEADLYLSLHREAGSRGLQSVGTCWTRSSKSASNDEYLIEQDYESNERTSVVQLSF